MTANVAIRVAWMTLGAYVLGSVPFGLLVGKARGVDVRTLGSKNIGATNVGRVLGRAWGVLVFALDMLKGLAAALSAGMLLPPGGVGVGMSGAVRHLCVLAVGIAAVLGHNYPVFLRFRGGKGVATTLGVALGVYPDLTQAALAALGVWALVTLVSRYVSLGSICAAGAFPLALVVLTRDKPHFWNQDWPLLACSGLLAAMIIVRHRSNILRLFKGTEPRIGKPRQVKGN